MGRIRTIKPEFPKSESVGRLSRDARLLFLQLLTYVDDHGRGRAHPRLLAGELYPYDDDVRDLLPAWLDELCTEGIALVYQVGGTQFLQILNWAKHQRVDNAGKSLIPPPPEADDEPSRPVGESPRAAASPREESEVRRESPRVAANRRESPQAAAVRGLDLGPRTMDLGPRSNTEAHAPVALEGKPDPGLTAPEKPDPDPSPDRSAEPAANPAADDGGATPRPARAKPQLGIRDCPDDVAPDVWRDFLAVRDGKRALVTETAIASLRREALRAGWTLEEVLRESTARGWQGFKAEWVLREAAANGDGRASPRGRNGSVVPKQTPEGYYGEPGQDPVQEF